MQFGPFDPIGLDDLLGRADYDYAGGATGTSTGLPIPDSAAIDAIARDLTKPSAAPVVASCRAYVAAFQANGVTGGNEAAVMKLLDDLATAVHSIDPAVADALASHAAAAAAWCRVKFMA